MQGAQRRAARPSASFPALVVPFAILAFFCVDVACEKSASDSPPFKPWPTRPTKTWKETVGPVSFEVQLPEGLGVYRDPRARIFRVDNLGLGPLVSIARVDQMPANIEAAMEDAIVGDAESFGTGKPEPDGFWVTVKNRKTGMIKVYRWLRQGNRALRCYADFFWRNEKPRDQLAHNALLERICRSVVIKG